jgi:hypothetical protein
MSIARHHYSQDTELCGEFCDVTTIYINELSMLCLSKPTKKTTKTCMVQERADKPFNDKPRLNIRVQ